MVIMYVLNSSRPGIVIHYPMLYLSRTVRDSLPRRAPFQGSALQRLLNDH